MFSADPDKYSRIFMDAPMPEMDGYDAARRVRELAGKRAGAPIGAMSANVFREDMDKCLRAGMNGRLDKPLNLGEVLDQLRQYLTPHE
ncbi:MAG: response regulator [Desulfarculales bacterium]|jgi:CheY-like chemotaxis protein|nr:response regulator [Desulfarculales bacterium]